MTEYRDRLIDAMGILAEAGYIFTGQAVRVKGTAVSDTLNKVPMEQRVELPVFENAQLGMATGIAMSGGKVCTIYPRINFMLEAISQLVQHLDKIPLFSDYRPRVIIRTAVATPIPLDAGVQHLGDYSDAVEAMLSTVKVVRLKEAEAIIPAYQAAMEHNGSTILVEYHEFF
jgi:pyruvate/2-oxoglutarate/acetoin dehydrogenase E1 component